jgi:hypothetical protein
MVLRLRSFKAIDDPESCAKFVKGHGDILISIGVNKVTSSAPTWIDNPGTYVLVVEDPETKVVLGGARVDTSFGTSKLPISDATSYLDPKVDDFIAKEAINGTGEICGLWNSRKVAGLGFGSLFLTRAAVTISHKVGVNSLFALCAPYTVATAETFGYSTLKEVGNEGTFYYPKLDLLATAMLLPDTLKIESATELEKERVFSLRKDPSQYFEEESRRRQVPIQYDLGIKV